MWAHAVSVGEAALLMPLLAHFAEFPGVKLLLTTNTLDSAKFVKKFAPKAVRHQFICWDSPRFVRRFLRHWRPDLALWAESELWPNMILQTAESTPIVLANGHLSTASYRRWRFYNRLFGDRLFAAVSECLAQNQKQAERFSALGVAKVTPVGNLKYAAPGPPPGRHLAKFIRLFRGRNIWAALSTHRGEEEKLLAAHRLLKGDWLLIIIPRHPGRGGEVYELAKAHGFAAACRTRTRQPPPNCNVYVADTLGEVGLWCRLATKVFVGGSWVKLGGHNPLEPLNCAATTIAFGEHTQRFAELYDELEASGIGFRVTEPKQLAAVIDGEVIRGEGNAAASSAAALKRQLTLKRQLKSRRRSILRGYIKRIEPYIVGDA